MKTKSIILTISLLLLSGGMWAQLKPAIQAKEKTAAPAKETTLKPDGKDAYLQNKAVIRTTKPMVVKNIPVFRLDQNGNIIRPGGGGSSSSTTTTTATADLTKKWAEKNVGAQPWGDMYEMGTDPCPSGYRLPTEEDILNLIEKNICIRYDDDSQNPSGIPGYWVGPEDIVVHANKNNSRGCLFFPSSGWYNLTTKELIGRGSIVFYPSSTYHTVGAGTFTTLRLDTHEGIGTYSYQPKVKLAVRCIRR